jgi:hypothetical protein
MAEEKFDEELKNLRNQVLDMMLESQKQEYSSKLESFEVYSEKVKGQFSTAYDDYLSHLKHGYEVIINGIAKQIKQ